MLAQGDAIDGVGWFRLVLVQVRLEIDALGSHIEMPIKIMCA